MTFIPGFGKRHKQTGCGLLLSEGPTEGVEN